MVSNTQIILVSDAAVHTTGQATCAWVIWAKQTLWSGEGYVPGHHDDTNSGLAEAYGVATVLGFLSQYTRLYPLMQQAKWQIHVYCDNQGVIERINNTVMVVYPRDTVRDDYPIYAEIQQQIRQLHPITLAFHHVKGHQDTKRDQPLTTPECLTVDCDQRAANVPLPCPDPDIQKNPLIEAAYPHVVIGGKIII